MEAKGKKHTQNLIICFLIKTLLCHTLNAGLILTPPLSEDEAESYKEIYDVPHPKGKADNAPQNE